MTNVAVTKPKYGLYINNKSVKINNATVKLRANVASELSFTVPNLKESETQKYRPQDLIQFYIGDNKISEKPVFKGFWDNKRLMLREPLEFSCIDYFGLAQNENLFYGTKVTDEGLNISTSSLIGYERGMAIKKVLEDVETNSGITIPTDYILGTYPLQSIKKEDNTVFENEDGLSIIKSIAESCYDDSDYLDVKFYDFTTIFGNPYFGKFNKENAFIKLVLKNIDFLVDSNVDLDIEESTSKCTAIGEGNKYFTYEHESITDSIRLHHKVINQDDYGEIWDTTDKCRTAAFREVESHKYPIIRLPIKFNKFVPIFATEVCYIEESKLYLAGRHKIEEVTYEIDSGITTTMILDVALRDISQFL